MVELFEARRPKEPAVITEVNGLVKFGEIPEEVYEAREETFDQDYTKPDFTPEEAVVTGGTYGADS